MASLDEVNGSGSPRRLRVYLQVNTSGESSKSGLSPLASDAPEADSDLVGLARHILTDCPSFAIMWPNDDWILGTRHMIIRARMKILSDWWHRVITSLAPWLVTMGRPPLELELSMGMSGDFIPAIEAGSNSVRVGSRAFGERKSKDEAKADRERESQSTTT